MVWILTFGRINGSGESVRKTCFPRLFRIDKNPLCSMADRYILEGERRTFAGDWRRRLFDWEEEQLEDLKKAAEIILGKKMVADEWRWNRRKDGRYTVRSAYEVLEKYAAEFEGQEKLNIVWNKVVPSKIKAFTWKVIQDRIPSILNLVKRGSFNIHFSRKCKTCDVEDEDTQHLFFECSVAKSVWLNVSEWFDFNFRSSGNGHKHLEDFLVPFENNLKVVGNLIWQCTIWHIWVRRNSIIFRGIKFSDDILFDKIVLIRLDG
ncbi:hypothetical protein ACS0TY_034944 [Phlomoides rotata]